MRVAKTKALISFAVTAKLICIFVFAYAKSQFSHKEAHLFVDCPPDADTNQTYTVLDHQYNNLSHAFDVNSAR